MRSRNREINRRRVLRMMGASSVAAGTTLVAGCIGDDDPQEADDDDGTDPADDDTETADDSEEPDEIQTGGELRIGMTADARDPLMPHTVGDTTSIIMVENMGNGLVRATPEGDIVPDLAEDWEVSDDGETWTFKIREGVQFHPPYDREVTAEDVVANFHHTLEEGWGGGQYTGVLVGEGLDVEETVVQTGEYEVQFNLAHPFSEFLEKQARLSAFGWFNIVPMDAVEEHGEDFGTFETGAWGTGAFMYNIEETTPGTAYVFDRNPNYWREGDGGQLPYVDRIVYEIIEDDTVRDTALEAGDIHISENLLATEIDDLRDAENVIVQTETGTEGVYLWMNIRNSDMFPKEVRQALGYAANREAIVDVAFQGAASPAISPLPPWASGFNEDAVVEYGHDPDRAQELLSEAGVDDLEFTCNPATTQFMVDSAQMLQQQFAQADIEMQVEPVSPSAAWEPMRGQWDDPDVPAEDWESGIESYTWGLSQDDFAFSTYHPDAGWNRTFWSTDRLEEVLEATRLETDPDQLQDYWDEFQEIITENLPHLPIAWPANSQGHRPNVHGLEVYPTEYLFLEEVWIEDE